MSTLGTNEAARRAWRPVIAFAAASLLALCVHLVYQRFAHGVRSGAMTWMFLYPLAGGCGLYALLALARPAGHAHPAYRLFANLYNAGIAALTAGSFLRGILEIAGAASVYAWCLPALGWALAALGLIALAVWLRRSTASSSV